MKFKNTLLAALAVLSLVVPHSEGRSSSGGSSSSSRSSFSSSSTRSSSGGWGSTSKPAAVKPPTSAGGWGARSKPAEPKVVVPTRYTPPVAPTQSVKPVPPVQPTRSAPTVSSGGWGTGAKVGAAAAVGVAAVPAATPTSSDPTTTRNSSTQQPTKVTTSAADQALAKKAAQNGTTFKSREEAVEVFKKKEATKYTTSFKTEPAKRPDYIPATYRNKPVYYDYSRGSYGVWDGPNWVAYSVASDAIMLNTLMARNNYYVAPPVATTTHVHHTGWSAFWTVAGTIVILGGIGGAIYIISRRG